jgi:hypothetical protein
MSEIWNEIKGYEGIYSVSNYGNVRNDKTGIILKQELNWGGYNRVSLCLKGKYKRISVHRLVADHFLENTNNVEQVNHINGIKADNKATNLEWVSASENILHSYRSLNRKSVKGIPSKKRKSVALFSSITNTVISVYDSIIEAAKDCNISDSTIINHCKGKTERPNYNRYWRYL